MMAYKQRSLLPVWALFGIILLIGAGRSVPAQTVTGIFGFAAPEGATLSAGLIQATDGNLYGTARSGGVNGGHGTVFRITTAGAITTLHSFGGADGAQPLAGLFQANDGALYGTTLSGGASNLGTVFKITTSGTFTTLYSFSGADGSGPTASLIQAKDGNLYGATSAGGASNQGTLFKITTAGALTTFYSFSGGDGSDPRGSLIQAKDGNFYGTTLLGGASNKGTVFQITTAGSLTTLYSFSGTDGAEPFAGLIQANDGNLYGTTNNGGAFGSTYGGYGTVFQITTAGSLTTLYNFGGADGQNPEGSLLQANDGNFYGTTSSGGADNNGTVFKITSGTLTTLYSFTGGADGAIPVAPLIQASDGNLYGTAETGINNGGTVFQITTSGTLTTLHEFTYPDGEQPEAGLVQAANGAFYGATVTGGDSNKGTLFKLTTAGALTTLDAFNGANGTLADASLVQASDGNLYGTTAYGGAFNNGTVFQITPSGTLTTLYSFSATSGSPPANTDGANPVAPLIQASDGNLYGTTSQGGAKGNGTVFKITTTGTLTPLYAFSGADGSAPFAPLLQASDGNFYGTTAGGGSGSAGTVFQFTPSGTLTTLHSFAFSATDGYIPYYGGLVQGADGALYGTTYVGGSAFKGTVYKITTAGSFTLLHSFTGADGQYPFNRLLQASDGNFYGTTESDSGAGNGTLYQITPTGTFTTLHFFAGLEGATPFAGLIQASDGDLYGTTVLGGAGGAGSVYRLSGVYPQPVLTSTTPKSANAGGPAFTLTVKGSAFQPFSTVDWNGSPLATTFVSATALKASVPASLIASPGTAQVTVVTGAGGGASKAKSFPILVTTVNLTAANLTRDPNTGAYTANITLKNVGFMTAPNVKVTKATLGPANTSTPLPVTVGDIASGATGNASLTFPSSAGTPGSTVTLKVSGTFTGGKISGSLKVKLP